MKSVLRSRSAMGKDKGFAWVWLERVHPKNTRVPQLEVLAVRVANELEKETLLATAAARHLRQVR